MRRFQSRRSIAFVLASALIVLCWVVPHMRAEEPEANPADSKGAPAATTNAPTPGTTFDPAVVSAGMAAFERSCTKCHDAARALDRTKDLAGWRATVRRMAARRGADIPAADMEPIATYLASRNAPASGTPNEKMDTSEARGDASSLSAFATLAPLFRGGDSHVQNPGFFPQAWVGGAWQGKILSARVTACVSCHGVHEGPFLNRIELVEAVARVDFSTWLEPCLSGMKAGLEAGRFVVPFGAFSAQTNPSLYRTVSTPLIFNMGQRVSAADLGDPVLPMPYADEGVNLNLDVPLADVCTGPITATVDAYLVNGLAGKASGIDFLESRDLVDNNNKVAGGGRLTLGGPYVRAGASITSGRFSDSGGPPGSPAGRLDYLIYGFDVQAHYKNLFRFQFEYARRDSDRFDVVRNGAEMFSEKVDGYYLEAEGRPWEKSPVSLLVRYDFLGRRSPLPPGRSTLLAGDFNVQRFTWGINVELWRQSLLMFNHEHWFLPDPLHSSDVFGVRYVITF